MLKIIFGYGADDETAIGNAIDEYNSVEGRKTYHESKVRQLQDNTLQSLHRYRCEIWYTLTSTYEQKKEQEEKFEFIGSTDIDPYDPNWREQWEIQQAPEKLCNECGMVHAPHENPLCHV